MVRRCDQKSNICSVIDGSLLKSETIKNSSNIDGSTVLLFSLFSLFSISQCVRNGEHGNRNGCWFVRSMAFPLTMTLRAIGQNGYAFSQRFCMYMHMMVERYSVPSAMLLLSKCNKCDDFYDYEILHLNNVRYISSPPLPPPLLLPPTTIHPQQKCHPLHSNIINVIFLKGNADVLFFYLHIHILVYIKKYSRVLKNESL